MELILRALLPAVACWMITAFVVWHQGESERPLVAARPGSRELAGQALRSSPPREMSGRLLRAGVWQEPPAVAGAKIKPEEFVGPPQPVMWEYLAAVRGKPSLVVLRSGTGEIKAFEEGKLLPDGALLIRVAMNSVTVRPPRAPKPIVIPTYRIETN